MTSHRENEQKLARMALFIDCARELIDEIGYKNVTIRKIADRAGYHNSTIYFYFSDLDYLMALASVRSFEEYSKELSGLSSHNSAGRDVFYPVWEAFCRAAFNKPDQYYQFFFGKYKDSVTDILNTYYRLFPEDKLVYSDIIEEMYFAPNFEERCRKILIPLIGAPETRVLESNLDLINSILIYSFESLLEKKCSDPELSTDGSIDQFMRILHFVIDR